MINNSSCSGASAGELLLLEKNISLDSGREDSGRQAAITTFNPLSSTDRRLFYLFIKRSFRR